MDQPIRNINYEDKPDDVINTPVHYHNGGIDVIALLGIKYPSSVSQGFFIGNVLKYVIRYQNKNGVEDLKKAANYLNKLIELEEAHEVNSLDTKEYPELVLQLELLEEANIDLGKECSRLLLLVNKKSEEIKQLKDAATDLEEEIGDLSKENKLIKALLKEVL